MLETCNTDNVIAESYNDINVRGKLTSAMHLEFENAL